MLHTPGHQQRTKYSFQIFLLMLLPYFQLVAMFSIVIGIHLLLHKYPASSSDIHLICANSSSDSRIRLFIMQYSYKDLTSRPGRQFSKSFLSSYRYMWTSNRITSLYWMVQRSSVKNIPYLITPNNVSYLFFSLRNWDQLHVIYSFIG